MAKLRQMQDEVADTDRRCTDLAGTFEKTAILEEARSTKAKGAEMMKTYLDRGSDSLDGFEFSTMVEAGGVGHWSVPAAMGQSSGAHPQVVQLVEWALPIQQRHLKGVYGCVGRTCR